RYLGMMGKANADAMVTLYASEKDADVRKAILNGLFVGGNDVALVNLARKESDPAMKKQIVRWLSNMNSKVARDYMMEILNQ
ncbi:MAG: HEAT repeat domain-containing protein, partial [Candidatus Acidiferrales bacterium]